MPRGFHRAYGVCRLEQLRQARTAVGGGSCVGQAGMHAAPNSTAGVLSALIEAPDHITGRHVWPASPATLAWPGAAQ